MTRPVFETRIETDEFTKAISEALDYNFEGLSSFQGWEKPIVPPSFGIGLIIGPSGSGKSLLLREFGEEESVSWKPKKAIVSHFENPNDAIERLMAVGLNSVPSWCRPFHVLSNGEQFRANLARKLKSGAVIDEFTSVVDRNVAKAAATATRRYVDKAGIKNLVLASCHEDILSWLRPDWYFDTATGILHDGRSLRRPEIKLRIYPSQKQVWEMFSSYHYLTPSFNKAADTYLATATLGADSDEVLVGFASAISFPMMGNKNGSTKKAYREHRTVIFPDFQGLGLGPRLSDAVAQIYVDQGKRYFSKTAHVRFGGYRDREGSGWIKTCKYRAKRDDIVLKKKGNWGKVFQDLASNSIKKLDRVCFSHEYLGAQ